MSQVQTVGKVATTIATDAEGVMRVTYHSTPVVTVYPNGRIVLDTGGWWTRTTKVRMNQTSNQFGLGFYVYQREFGWRVDVDGHTLMWGGQGDGPYPITIRNGS